MRAVLHAIDTGSKAASLLLGGTVVALAIAVMATQLTAAALADWAQQVFGLTFIGLLAGLIFATFFCWVRLRHTSGSRVWLEAGMQSANGITTLALTYTLLGISLGVGGLAAQELTPDTVQSVVRGLTEKFSLAFLTTVVGLPTSAVLRTLLLVTNARIQTRALPGAAE
jgi:uncharacterized membrane protein